MSSTNLLEMTIKTQGEGFYSITKDILEQVSPLLSDHPNGVLYVFCQHTSCALTISESYDPSAKEDLEQFLKHLAPRNLDFIKHDTEGPDDSPSHMKSILLQNHLCLPVHEKNVSIGQWQGLYLAEFRDNAHKRKLLLKVI